MTETNDISFTLMLVTQSIYRRCTVISCCRVKRMKIDKFKKLVCSMYDKKNYVVFIKILKLALD